MIKYLMLKNWKNHDELILTFRKGVNFIIGPNGIGKTSILEAIIFNLMGRVRNKKNKNNFKMIGKRGKTEVILHLETNEEKLELIRNFNGRMISELRSNSLSKSISGSNNVEKFILDLFQTNKFFFENVTYSTEGETHEFLEASSREFVSYLETLFGFGKTNDFKKILIDLNHYFKKENNDIEKKIKTLKKLEMEKEIGDLSQLVSEKDDIQYEIEILEKKIQNGEKKIRSLKEKIFKEQKSVVGYNELISKMKIIFSKMKDFFTSINIHIFDIKNILSKKEELMDKMNDFERDFKLLKKEIQKKQEELLEIKVKIRGLDEIKNIIDDLKKGYDEKAKISCPVCEKVITPNEFLKIHENNIVKLKEYEKIHQDLRSYLLKMKDEENQLQEKIKHLENLQPLLDSITKKEVKSITDTEQIVQQYEKERKELMINTLKNKNQMSERESRLIKIEIALTKLKLADDIKEINKFEDKYTKSMKGVLICEMTIEAINQVLKKQRGINMKYLVEEIMRIWKSFFPFEDRELLFNNQFIPYFKRDGYEIPFRNISAGEKMVLLILIKTILLREYTKIPFLILDEPLEHLNLENRIKIIDYFIEIQEKGFIDQLIITTFEESLTRKYLTLPNINIISLSSLKKYGK